MEVLRTERLSVQGDERVRDLWAVVERATGEVVGACGFLADGDGVEIGWRIRADRRGRGYGTEVARACLRHGFERLGFERVSAYVDRGNEPSKRIAVRLGMRPVRAGGGDEHTPPWVEFVLAGPTQSAHRSMAAVSAPTRTPVR